MPVSGVHCKSIRVCIQTLIAEIENSGQLCMGSGNLAAKQDKFKI